MAHEDMAGAPTIAAPGRVATALRWWHTLRHLRPVQFWRRATFRLARPRPDLAPPPPRRPGGGPWVLHAAHPGALTAPDRFTFLNETHTLAAVGWDDPAIAKLWRYNQHYFADLVAEDAAGRAEWHAALLDDWMRRNPPGQGSGWEPYPTSLRVVNVIKWALGGGKPSEALLASLAVQARWLGQRIEWHLLANHLFVNGKALLFAGLFFDGAEAATWRRTGAAILDRELDEQILPDGAQFELSPMYHLLALDDVLDLVNVIRWSGADGLDRLETRLVEKAGAMLGWARAMVHPDGAMAQFNDAAQGIAPTLEALTRYAARLRIATPPAPAPLTRMADSGYIRMSAGDAVLIADVAHVGPRYQAGHAHADTLSFELSVGAARVFVNGGTGTYGTGADRAAQRATRSHNTVEVAGRNSTDVWGGFRTGHRARPFDVRHWTDGEVLGAAAAHDGYRALAGRPVHRRAWMLAPGKLTVTDEVTGGRWPAVARFHLHPDITILDATAHGGTLRLADGRTAAWRVTGGSASVTPSTWHPEFGIALTTRCIAVQLPGGGAASTLTLEWTRHAS